MMSQIPEVPLESFDYDGHPRILACLPPHPFCSFPPYSASNPVIPQAQWKEFEETLSEVPILDQDGKGSCTGHGSCSAMEKAWVRSGQQYQEFSPTFVYGLNNGGRDRGAVVSDCLKSLESTGICLASEVPEGVIFSSQFPKSSYVTAARFKVEDAYSLSSFEEMCSAIQLRFDVVFGILVGNGFTNLDSSGVPPVGGNGGHCLCDGEGMKNDSTHGWIVKTRNSWSTSYGLNGFCWLSKAHFDYSMRRGGFDAFAIRSVFTDPQSQIPGVIV